MSAMRGDKGDGLWLEFQNILTEFAGLSVQAFNERGCPTHPAPRLPPLCALLQRYPEMHAACQKDCFSRPAACREARRILSTRCYAGLSHRIIPIRRRNRPHAMILVGRVLTDVIGGEQCLGFIERNKLPRKPFLDCLAGVRSLGSSDLDRIAVFVRRLATTFIAGDIQQKQHRVQLGRKQLLLDLARRTTACQDDGPGRMRMLLEALGRLLGASGAAILVAGDAATPAAVHASVGLGEDVLHVLAHQDWPGVMRLHGRGVRLVLADRQAMLGAGFDCPGAPLAVQQLGYGSRVEGYLVVSGAAMGAAELKMLESASAFVAALLVHLKYRERAEQKDEEARLLGRMAEQCLTAHSVEELLPLALEAAMCSLHARRGSILLAEEAGRITAHALRGAHAPISGTIEELRPDSVSYKVFFNRRSMLVQDTDREPGLARERQFPYATRSFVSVPLRENGHALGVLHLSEREGEEVFTPRDLSLLERLSLQASAAIRKARLEEEVQSLRVSSAIDHLTGVYNRRYLDGQLAVEFQRAQRYGQPLAVAMLDIDSFKNMNDAQGHEYGDKVLKLVAGTVRRQLRSVDILARYGGDEFVLLLPGTNAAGALNTVEKIRRLIESAPPPGKLPPSARRTFTVSVGVSAFPETSTSAEDLLRHADQSLLFAKTTGKNTTSLHERAPTLDLGPSGTSAAANP